MCILITIPLESFHPEIKLELRKTLRKRKSFPFVENSIKILERKTFPTIFSSFFLKLMKLVEQWLFLKEEECNESSSASQWNASPKVKRDFTSGSLDSSCFILKKSLLCARSLAIFVVLSLNRKIPEDGTGKVSSVVINVRGRGRRDSSEIHSLKRHNATDKRHTH